MANADRPTDDDEGAAEAGPGRILVMGGTFDPPHLAHTRLAELAAQQLGCEEILFVPAAVSPLKGDQPIAGNQHRLAMLLLSIADLSGARISTIEIDRGGKSYTIDTLRELAAESARSQGSDRRSGVRGEVASPLAPGSAGGLGVQQTVARRMPKAASREPGLFLLIGADQALDFHRWKDWQQILMLARPAVMLRPPWNEESFAAKLREVYTPLEAEHWISWTLRLPIMDIGATEIRRRFQSHQSTEGLLHPAVAEYIRANGLYEL